MTSAELFAQRAKRQPLVWNWLKKKTTTRKKKQQQQKKKKKKKKKKRERVIYTVCLLSGNRSTLYLSFKSP